MSGCHRIRDTIIERHGRVHSRISTGYLSYSSCTVPFRARYATARQRGAHKLSVEETPPRRAAALPAQSARCAAGLRRSPQSSFIGMKWNCARGDDELGFEIEYVLRTQAALLNEHAA